MFSSPPRHPIARGPDWQAQAMPENPARVLGLALGGA